METSQKWGKILLLFLLDINDDISLTQSFYVLLNIEHTTTDVLKW